MRDYCEHCHYPQSQCLCDAATALTVSADISILQHPKERRHAKNTARLVALCLPHTHLVGSDDEAAVSEFRSRCRDKKTAVIYPAADSTPIEHPGSPVGAFDHWVFLDGSWKQAFALYKQFAFLQILPAYHFSAAPVSHYTIRHTQIGKSLSTLEAVAYCLQQAGNDGADALLRVQQALVDRWQGPAEHRRRQ